MKTEEFINILKKLQTIGVDVSKIIWSDTIETLAEKSEISKEKLEEIGLDPMLKIGLKRTTIVQAYRGKGNSKPPTQEQIEKLAKLGISIEKRKRDTVQEFIDTLEILQTIGVDVSKLVTIDTVETLAKRSEISKEKLEEMGLDSTLKIGNQKTRIGQAYRGKGTNKPPTKEQVKELVKLGVSLEKQEKDTMQEFINILRKLQTIGVNVSKLVARDTIETLAKKSGISSEKLEKTGLDPTLRIGNKKTTIVQAYRGQGTNKPPTKKQVEELAKLGISLERKRITGKKIAKASIISLTKQKMKIEEFINILKTLQTIGVDVSKIVRNDTIETLAKKSGISKEKLEEIGLDPMLKIGLKRTTIVQAYRGKGNSKPPTQEQIEKLAKLGISIEKRKRDTVQEFIDTLEILQTIGVDISKLVAKDTIETLAEKSGISKEKLEEIGLDLTLKIGNQRTNIVQAYRGKGNSKPPTQEQIEELAKLGISSEKQRRGTVQEFIDTLEILQTIGVDVSKLTENDTIEKLAKKSEISREKVEEIGVDPAQKIGNKKHNIAQAYRGQGTCEPPTEKQVEELAKLGISLERKRTTGKKIVEASIISLTAPEMADTEDAVLKALVKQRKQKLR